MLKHIDGNGRFFHISMTLHHTVYKPRSSSAVKQKYQYIHPCTKLNDGDVCLYGVFLTVKSNLSSPFEY